MHSHLSCPCGGAHTVWDVPVAEGISASPWPSSGNVVLRELLHRRAHFFSRTRHGATASPIVPHSGSSVRRFTIRSEQAGFVYRRGTSGPTYLHILLTFARKLHVLFVLLHKAYGSI